MDSDRDHYTQVSDLTGLSVAETLDLAAQEAIHPVVFTDGWFLMPAVKRLDGRLDIDRSATRLSYDEPLRPDPGYYRGMVSDPKARQRGRYSTIQGRQVWAEVKGGAKPGIGVGHLWVCSQEIERLGLTRRAAVSPGQPEPQSTEPISFYEDNGTWYIGRETYPDLNGFKYLHKLLANPNVPSKAWVLYDETIRALPENIEQMDHIASEELGGGIGSDRDDGQRTEMQGLGHDPQINSRARGEYIDKVKDLNDEIAKLEAREDRCPEEEELLQRSIRDRDFIQGQLNATVQLGGKPRPLNTPQAEKKRIGVYKNLQTAYKTIAATQPKLVAHFEKAVDTGNVLIYRPPSDAPVWILERPA